MPDYDIPPNGGPDAQGWARILTRLEEDRESLVVDFLARLSGLGFYDANAVPGEDLHQTASDTMDMLIRQLAGVPLPPHLRSLPARLGVRRARQGVDRESLLEAVRLDFRVLWSGLMRASGDDSAETIVLHAEELLSTVERYIGDVQVAFLDEQAALVRDSRLQVSRAFSRLLASGDRVGAVAEEVADDLGVSVNATFEVAFVLATGRDFHRRVHPATLAHRHLRWDYDTGVALVREERSDGPWTSINIGVGGGYLGGIRGLAAVPAAIESARAVASHAAYSQRRLATEQDVWLVLASERLHTVLPQFGRTATEGLAAIATEERQRLLETLLEFAGTGSIKDTAANLYCHRNTVVNRLKLLHTVTGLDVAVPLQAAQLLVALGPGLARVAAES